ncbi:cytochrome P450 [Microbispora hainanensis]|uniref:cytochrome P450 n=1 Tax=Microbispora TaxID=2005 RepID=UPI0011579121|nr:MULTISPECIES: cytochrome P450 [Microbispora]NJP25115.1 cytochrome P450 [Microbispora sp. CL1-1]TQS14027.1 cytochrome P450 [Microbispora sp. SCL1-1]
MPLLDTTLLLLLEGYAWLPARWREAQGVIAQGKMGHGESAQTEMGQAAMARTRLMGRDAVVLRGPDAVRFFYDDNHVQRAPALPEPIKSTLFGHGAVHTLDQAAHRARKGMFMSLMTPESVASLVGEATAAWYAAVATWHGRGDVVLFDEAARVLTRGACRWAGIPLAEEETGPLAGDLVALVDGFGSPGPRHWRARAARKRREAWLAGLVGEVRRGALRVPDTSALAVVARHLEPDGERLAPRIAAVELLNLVRPTVAVSWFVTFAAHALHHWQVTRVRLTEDTDGTYAEAFAHEVRRFYPFAPFVAGTAVKDLTWKGEQILADWLVLLDIWGQNHDPALWPHPYTFDPQRFIGRGIGPYDLIPQGGGDPVTGHRCPGEPVAVGLLKALAPRLAKLDYTVPEQDLTISPYRIPARVASGFVLRPAGAAAPPETAGAKRPRPAVHPL